MGGRVSLQEDPRPVATEQQTDNKQDVAEAQQEKQPPHNYETILKEGNASPIDKSSREGVVKKLQEAGIFLNENKMKYWIDSKSKNCFMVYARDLSITWGGDSRYWRWYPVQETSSDVSVDVAELLDVCWLEVHGYLNIAYLTPETLYEAVFVIKLNPAEYGWEDPVEFSLDVLDDKKTDTANKPKPKVSIVDLMQYRRGQWVEICAGEFKPSPGQTGKIDVKLQQLGQWKKGLVIKGVMVRPKTQK